jgi:3,4-dihydroxy 2-butanone 4-phosphate synthase/GTP cyclohydrolase II
VSALDRSKTVKALVDINTKPQDLQRPGHIFPLIAKNGGVLRRTGHTEAAIDFARLAGFKSAGVIVEIMNDDGSMSRLPELVKVAEKFNLRIVSIEDLVAYRMKNDSLISKSFDKDVETNFGTYRLRAYKQTNNDQVHIALTLGKLNKVDNDVTKILSGTNEKKYDKIFDQINKVGKGAVIFINQNQSSENILKKLNSMSEDSEKPKIDFRDFGIGAQILHDLEISKVNLLSNSEQKHRVGLSGYGLSIVDYTNY